MLHPLLQVPEFSDSEELAYGKSSSMELLLLFQRYLLGNIYSNSSPHLLTSSQQSPTAKDQANLQIQGGIAVLMKYISMLHHHTTQVLPTASQLVSLNPKYFKVASQILRKGPVVTLIPELSVSMVLLQLKMPFKLLESKCVPLVGELMKLLDDFNSLAPGAYEEDEQDLAWPDSHGNKSGAGGV